MNGGRLRLVIGSVFLVNPLTQRRTRFVVEVRYQLVCLCFSITCFDSEGNLAISPLKHYLLTHKIVRPPLKYFEYGIFPWDLVFVVTVFWSCSISWNFYTTSFTFVSRRVYFGKHSNGLFLFSLIVGGFTWPIFKLWVQFIKVETETNLNFPWRL